LTTPPVAARHAHTSQRRARVAAVQVLYELDGARHDAARALGNRLADDTMPDTSEAYASELVHGVLASRAEIDETIAAHAPAWPVEQLAPVDRNILRVAVYEMTVADNTPPKVAINEAVEMGKTFGGDNSPRFINGVLGSVIEHTGPYKGPVVEMEE
jgi:N utilization substance protein B